MYLYRKRENAIAGFSGSEGVRGSERATQSDTLTVAHNRTRIYAN